MSNLIVLPVRVSIAMTKSCVASLLSQDIPVQILAIDNGSDDGCAQYLRTCRDVQVITYPKPMGLSRLWNNALDLAFDHLKLPYAMICNNDVILRSDTYRWLVANGGPFVTGIGVSSHEQTLATDVTNRRNHPDFSTYLTRKEVWEKVGRFDESMVTYCSDCDYHIRMYRAGIPAYCIGVPFYHVASGTLKHLEGKEKEAIQHQADADRETFEKKWGCLPGTPQYSALFH